MDQFTPASIPLPKFLDPLLDYLSSILPPQFYSVIIYVFSHLLALLTALVSLTATLITSKPWEWDAQTVIPPLISFLAAYLALVSIYRTTSWMFRTSVWFIKWGSIFGALMAGAGWYMGNVNANGVGMGGGIASGLGGLVLNLINGENKNAAGGPRSRSRSSRSRSQSSRGGRPNPWDSFTQHREWQYQENGDAQEAGDDVKKVIGEIVGAAGRVVRDGGWWEATKKYVDSQLGGGEESQSTREQPARKAKTRAKNSRSR